jgi:isoamylase
MELLHRTSKTISAGSAFPLGASLHGNGVNFAIYSKEAKEVFLLLFETPDGEPTDVIQLKQRNKFIWHAHISPLKAGQLYGYKVRGEYRPAWGLRFNEAKLLLDPYTKAVTGKFRNHDGMLYGYDAEPGGGDDVLDRRDTVRIAPKSIVVDDGFDWQGDNHSPSYPLEHLDIYEVHVKGFTAHPSSGVEHPGTYLGFVEKIPYLTHLGINAVELLPVHESYTEDALAARGLTNYWGYNSIGFFAPESTYSTQTSLACQVGEFKTMIRELHKAGIRVILDVVYNHTGEGSETGPTLSLRGVDNTSYYRLHGLPEAPRRHYTDYSGCGNNLNLESPPAMRLVMDSLRYWVEAMHIDGFRFDLASVLGRDESGRFRSSASFFDAVSQDPILNRAIIIAEPWDIGQSNLGNFPVDWSEWNSRFRDTVRRFGKGDGAQLRHMGWRITGSADLYGSDGRSAYNSVNFITCHDGFTLYDLVSYNAKHNEANGENNRDGTNDNASWNWGVEGDTSDPAITKLRKQLIKNYACYLFFSCGTAMMLGGDEFGRTQGGNNNAYCQDNEVSWFDWRLVSQNADLVTFFRKAIAFPDRFPVMQRRQFPLGADLDDDGVPDLAWFPPTGSRSFWEDPEGRTLFFQMDATEDSPIEDATRLFFIYNAHFESKCVELPPLARTEGWLRAIDTSLPAGEDFADAGDEVLIDPPGFYLASPRSCIVLLARRNNPKKQ